MIDFFFRNIFTEGELDKKSVYANFAYTAADGKNYDVEHYNLDVIISVGYIATEIHIGSLKYLFTKRIDSHQYVYYIVYREVYYENKCCIK